MKRPVSDSQHGTVTGYRYGCRCDDCKDARRAYTKRWQQEKLESGDVPHGTLNGFNNYACRCDRCTAAKSAEMTSERAVMHHRRRATDYREQNREAFNTKARDWRERKREEDAGDFEHGPSGYVNHGCHCDVCSDAARERAKLGRRAEQAQTPALEAQRYGYQWTGPELELIATRDDLTIVELAKMLGRTARAVRKARDRVRHDPKWMKVAGVDDA